MQCIALALVTIAGVLISIADTSSPGDLASQTQNLKGWGLAALLMGTSLSGLGAGITERVLHKECRNNYQLSAEMALVGCTLVTCSLILGLTPDAVVARREGLFTNWDKWTFIPVFTQGSAGILVGLITKVAGSVKKGFATICGIILTCVIRSIFMGMLPSFLVSIAVALAAGSIYLHSIFPLQKIQVSHK